MKQLLFLALSLLTLSLSAQESLFNKGDQSMTLTLGIGTSWEGKTILPPLALAYERGVKDDMINGKGTLSFGGYLAMSSSRYETTGLYGTIGYKYTYTIIGATGTFHYPFIDKLDTYTTVMLGYNIVGAKFESDGIDDPGMTTSGSAFIWSGMIGAKYYFNENIGALAELGYGIAYLNLGLVYKF